MPIFPSPSYHGYDVTNYYEINPDYGTMDDFKTLLEEAHSRGIRVIIDLVINHTSNQHPWFTQAKDPSSPYHDWYIWSDTNLGYTGSWGQQVWFPIYGNIIIRLLLRDAGFKLQESGSDRQNGGRGSVLAGRCGRGWIPDGRRKASHRRRYHSGKFGFYA